MEELGIYESFKVKTKRRPDVGLTVAEEELGVSHVLGREERRGHIVPARYRSRLVQYQNGPPP
jgi:hypothetical protein